MRPTWKSLRYSSVCVAISLLAGCAAPRVERVATYVSPVWEEGAPSRIVVVPFDGPACPKRAGTLVTRALAMELQDALHADVITAPDENERLAAESALWRRGRVSIDALVAARKTFLADAFVFGTITHYKEYDPPVLGLKVSMLSARTGEVIWAAEALFDAHSRPTRALAETYFENSGLSHTLYGSGLMFMSPRLFARFVATEMVRPLQRRLTQLRRPEQSENNSPLTEELSGSDELNSFGNAVKRLLRLKS